MILCGSMIHAQLFNTSLRVSVAFHIDSDHGRNASSGPWFSGFKKNIDYKLKRCFQHVFSVRGFYFIQVLDVLWWERLYSSISAPDPVSTVSLCPMWCCPESGFHWFGCVSGGPRCSRSRSIKGSCFGPHFYMHSRYFKGCIHIRTPSLYMYMYIYILYLCVCVPSLSLSRICVYSICIYVYMYMYMHMHVHVHMHMHMYIYMYICESWFFIKCTVCLNQYQPSYSGGVFPANVSMAWGIGKLYKTDKQKGVDHYCGTTKALACTSKSYRMIAILDAIMMVSSTADHALKEIAAAHIHPCKSPLTSRFTIFIPFIPILQNFPGKNSIEGASRWPSNTPSTPKMCLSFSSVSAKPAKVAPKRKVLMVCSVSLAQGEAVHITASLQWLELGNSTSQCSRMHDDYPRVS